MNADDVKVWATFCRLTKEGREKAAAYLFELAELRKYYPSG